MATAPLTNQDQSRPLSAFLWIGLTQVYAFFSAWAIFSGGQMLRAFGLGSVTLAMIIPLLINFQAGLMALIIFEPFRGLLRRMQYLFVPYSQNEPIHLITPFVTFIAFVLVIQREKLQMFFETKTAKLVTFLAAICFLQIFNPLQGSLFIGLTGALFYLVPMAWFYFGQTISEEFFIKTLKMIVILGMITSLYGVYQIVAGYPDFERYWIENTDQYSSIAVYNVTRGLATFSNAEEWGRYALLGSLIAFGLALVRSEENKRPLWMFAGIFLCGMLVLSGQRSSIFGLLLGVAVLFVTGARTFSQAFGRMLLLFAPIVLFLALSSSLSEDDIYEMDDSQGISTMLSHTTKGTVNPTGEGSLAVRFTTWNYLLTETLPANPFGAGLGSDSTSVAREGGEKKHRAIDNHFLSLAVSAGIPAMILLIWILFRAFRLSISEWRESEINSDRNGYWRIILALLSTFVLNNFFGTSFVIYSVAPVGWLLLGWISSQADAE